MDKDEDKRSDLSDDHIMKNSNGQSEFSDPGTVKFEIESKLTQVSLLTKCFIVIVNSGNYLSQAVKLEI